jgi:hypothetical protein
MSSTAGQPDEFGTPVPCFWPANILNPRLFLAVLV